MCVRLVLVCGLYIVRLGAMERPFSDRARARRYGRDLAARLGIRFVADCDEDVFYRRGHWRK